MAGYAQWQRVETLEGIDVTDFTSTTDGTLYAAAVGDQGLYYSTNGGDQWIRRDDLDSLDVFRMESFGTDLFAHVQSLTGSTGKLLLLRGATAVPEILEMPWGNSMRKFSLDANGWIYATFVDSPRQDDVFRSTDAGHTWNFYSPTVDITNTLEVLVPADEGRLWAATRKTIGQYSPADSKWTVWQDLHPHTGDKRAIIPLADGTALVSIEGGVLHCFPTTGLIDTIFTTRDSVSISTGWAYRGNDGRLFLMDFDYETTETGPGVFLTFPVRGSLSESLDQGATWAVVDSSLPGDFRIIGEYGGIIFATSRNAVLRSADHGRSWERCTYGIASATLRHFEVRENRIHGVGKGYMLSADAGETWNYPGVDMHYSKATLQVTTDGVFYEKSSGLRISRDSARTWEQPFPMTRQMQLVDLLALDDLVLASLQDSTIRRSLDQGRTWEIVHHGQYLIWNLIQSGNSFLALDGTDIVRSTDRGATWTRLPKPTSDRVILAANGTAVIAAWEESAWISHDDGDTWAKLPMPLLDGLMTRLVMDVNGNVAVLTSYFPFGGPRRVYLSTDEGLIWREISDGLPYRYTNMAPLQPTADIQFLGDRLYVNVDGRGLYYREGIPTSVHREFESAIPLQLSVWPSTCASTLKVVLHSEQQADMRVTSLSGEEIYTAQVPAGQRTLVIDVRSWPTGTYFLHAVAGSASAVKPFMVVR